MDKAEEQRRSVRVPGKLPILYEDIFYKTIGEYLTKDISQRGLRFLVHDFIPWGSYLMIRMILEPYFSCEALVKVVWIREHSLSEEFEIGVEFISMPDDAQWHLIEYIRACLAAAK